MLIRRISNGYFPLLWFSIIGVLLFARTLTFDYTYQDDKELILDQMDKLGSLSYVPECFTTDAFPSIDRKPIYYRPILTLSFVMDAILGGGSFFMFHLTNILLHIFATWLLFLLLLELGYDRNKSFLFALIFLVHPVVSHAVAWVPGRNDPLLAIFLFPSFIYFIRYLRTRRNSALILHVLFYILALFSKETAISIPVVFTAYVILLDRTNIKGLVYPSLSWLTATPAWLLLRYNILDGSNGYSLLDSMTSIFNDLPAVIPYIGKSLIPVGLCVMPILKDMTLSFIMGCIVILAIGIIVFFTRGKRWEYFIFAMLWFLLFLLPAFIQNNIDKHNFSEHRIYISLAGLIIFLLETGPVKRAQPASKALWISSICIFVIFSILTSFHLQNFKDGNAFWTNATKKSPNRASSFINLGVMQAHMKNYPEAEKSYFKALEIDPNVRMAYYNLALAYYKSNRKGEAEINFLKEIKVNPYFTHAYVNLGSLYYENRLYDRAIEFWEKSILINPSTINAYLNLNMIYGYLNRPEDQQRIRKLAALNGIRLD